MIKLRIDDYCSNCYDFEASVEKLEIGISHCNTLITCKNAMRCAMLITHLRSCEENKEKNND